MITYEQLPGDQIRVRVAGTITGRIVRAAQGGWQYKPIGSSLSGDVYPTVEQVKRSLEADDDSDQRHEQIGGEYRCSKCRAEFKTIPDFDRHKCINEHQVTKSGTCVIEGCPCRGWSAQELAKEITQEESMNTNDTVNALKEFGEVVERIPSVTKDEIIRQDERERLQEIRAASHQPAARGGGDEWRTAGQVVPDCEYTIVGMTVIHKRASSELVALTRDKQVAAQIVNEHRQHQSLVAERERLRQAIEVAIHNLNAGNDPKFLADYLQLTLDQQRSTSE